MTVGFVVDKGSLDSRVGEAARNLAVTLASIRKIKLWLDDNPGYDATSDLVALGYTEDEAYLLHTVFTQLDEIRTTHADALALARKLTGLE